MPTLARPDAPDTRHLVSVPSRKLPGDPQLRLAGRPSPAWVTCLLPQKTSPASPEAAWQGPRCATHPPPRSRGQRRALESEQVPQPLLGGPGGPGGGIPATQACREAHGGTMTSGNQDPALISKRTNGRGCPGVGGSTQWGEEHGQRLSPQVTSRRDAAGTQPDTQAHAAHARLRQSPQQTDPGLGQGGGGC